MTTIAMMGAASFLIGVLPTYNGTISADPLVHPTKPGFSPICGLGP